MRSPAVLILLIIIVVALSIASVRLDSATSDEPAHIANGVIKLTHGWLDFFREQPPLMNSLSALPVVLSGYRIAPGWKGGNHWVVGRTFLYRSGYDAYRILFLARLPTIALFAALVAVVFWFVYRETASAMWALIAATLTGFCPTLMAHGRLATVDLALTFFAFASTALLLSLIASPSSVRATLFGITAAAAPMSKVSGLILGPFFVAVVVAALIARRIPNRKEFFKAIAIGCVAGLLFFEAIGLTVTSSAFAQAEYSSTPRLVIPFVEYLANVRTINAWYTQGHALPQFLMGDFSRSGWPHYYLAAFLLKTPIPAILLAIGGIVAGLRSRSFAFFCLLAFVVMFFAIAALGHLALGIRYVLPIYPFLYAATAIALSTSNLRRGAQTIVILFVAWHALENLKTYPHYIAYFNELIGSERNADAFLIDSNLDWGQDLRRLDQWARAQHLDRIAVHYFGGGSVEYELRAAKPVIRYAPGPDLLPPGYFALSRHFYRISFYLPLWRINYDDYLALCNAHYVTSIGASINIYRIDPPARK